MTQLTRDSILAANDITIERVDLPEWGGHLFVKTMSGSERDAWEVQIVTGNKKAPENIRAQLAAMTVCDECGNLLFTAGDIPDLSKRSAAALDRIMDVSMRLNNLSQKHVEELEKN